MAATRSVCVLGGGPLGVRVVRSLLDRSEFSVTFVGAELPAGAEDDVAACFTLSDLSHPKSCDLATRGASVVIDLGAPLGGASFIAENDASIARAFGVRTYNLLEAARRNGCEMYCLASALRASCSEQSTSAARAQLDVATSVVKQYGAGAGAGSLATVVVHLGCIFGPGLPWRGGRESVVAAICAVVSSPSTTGDVTIDSFVFCFVFFRNIYN